MMKSVKAFPHQEWIDSDNPRDFNPIHHPEMDLRDYFAAKAMQALITCAENGGDIPHKMCAVDAYRYANAMMGARDEKN